jgi:tRNA threonylcarbamoyladenosine biosynthesis protein TsaB
MSHDRQPALLALHTTEPTGSVAVATQAGRHEALIVSGGAHAPALLDAVLKLLRVAGTGFDELAGVVVTTGPGSFTGIRVGLATAQGLAAARGWPLHACDSLLARAAVWSGHADPLAVVLDARRGEVYAALYDVRSFPPRVLVAPFCATPGEASARLAAGLEGDGVESSGCARLAVTGSGAPLLAATLPAAVPLQDGPRSVAAALIDLAWGGGCEMLEPHAVEPTYLRKSDAEVRRESTVPRGI